MKSIILALLTLLFTTTPAPALAGSPPVSTTEAVSPASQHSLPGNLTQDELLNLKPKEIAARSGQKLSFFQRMALRMVQKKLKKQKARQQKKGLKGEPTPAGKASLWFGISSLGALPLYILAAASGLSILAVMFLFAFPILSILGFIFGLKSRAKGDQSGAAKTGRTIGTTMAIIFGLFLLFGLIVLASGGIDFSISFPLPGG